MGDVDPAVLRRMARLWVAGMVAIAVVEVPAIALLMLLLGSR